MNYEFNYNEKISIKLEDYRLNILYFIRDLLSL